MPFLVLFVGILFIVLAVAILRIHPFLALILAAVLVGVLSPVPLTSGHELRDQVSEARRQLIDQRDAGILSPGEFERRWEAVPWELQETWLAGQNRVGGQPVLALELTAQEFGITAGGIGIVIALAAVIGLCLMESGAADKITRRALAVVGEKRAPTAMLGSGFILSIPVFFDTVFFLLIPLARALRMRTGRNYVYFVMAMGAGGVITHSLVPPTPGPLLMTDTLPGLDLGTTIGLGILLGIVPAIVGGLLYAGFLNRRMDIPVRDVAGSSRRQLEEIVARPESELPGFWASILPVVLPVVLITGDTVLQSLQRAGTLVVPPALLSASAFLGNRNMALLLAACLAVWVLARQKGLSLGALRNTLEPALLSAGVIILITSAGGAFGRMLARTGISESLQQLTTGDWDRGVVYILMAWGLASIMKIAQGSGTVSMITASAMMAAILGDPSALPYHMIYIYAAVGFGSLVISWMNDSGFWVVCKMSGFTEEETLKTWTTLLLVIGVVGLLQILVLSAVVPLK